MSKKPQRPSRGHQDVIRRYQPLLSGHKLQPKLLSQLKSEPLGSIEAILALLSPARRIAILGTPTRLTSYASSFSTSGFSGSLAHELTWAVATLRSAADVVNGFAELKQRFEREILVGNYREAAQALEASESQYGLSLWLGEQRLLLAEYGRGLKENHTIADRLLHGAGFPFGGAFTFLSQRVERHVTIRAFTDELAAFEAKWGNSGTGVKAGLAHLRFRVAPLRALHTQELASVVHSEMGLPPVDLYHGTIRALQLLYLREPKHPESTSLVRALSRSLSAAIPHRTLQTLGWLLSPRTPSVSNSDVPPALSHLVELYTKGRYAECLAILVERLPVQPDVYEFYEIAVRSALHLRTSCPAIFADGSLSAKVLSSLHAAWGLGEGSTKAAETLGSLGLALDSTMLGQHLQAVHNDLTATVPSDSPGLYHALFQTAPTARFIRALRPELRGDYAAEMIANGQMVVAAKLFGPYVANDSAVEPDVPLARRLAYRGRAALDAGEYRSASEAFAELLSSGTITELARRSAIKGLVSARVGSGKIDQAAELLVREYRRNRNCVPKSKIFELATHYRAALDDCDKANIAWPLLHLAEAEATGERDIDALSAASQDFLASHGAERPSELLDDKAFEKDSWIAFLRNICTPEVLDYSVAYEGSNDLDNERIRLLQALRDLDGDDAEHYSHEISKITQQQMLRNALQHLSAGKVEANIEAIKAAYATWAEGRFQRFVSYVTLGDLLDTGYRRVQLDASAAVINTSYSISAITQFANLLQEFKNRFVSSNEHGIDSYLSLRIRHGTLSGNVRRHFQKERLLTVRSEEAYSSNTHWLSQFADLPAEQRSSIDDAFRALSEEVDTIVEDVRAAWIQIRSVAKPTGMFDFDYSETDVVGMYPAAKMIRSYEDFVQFLVDEMLRRTQSNLEAARLRIQRDLQSLLLGALDRFATSIHGISPLLRHSDLNEGITRCRNGVPSACKEIASWFNLSQAASAPDFQLPLLADTAAAIVEKCFPDSRLRVNNSVSAGVTIRGRYFAPLNDVMFILLDNVIKHSGMAAPTADVRIVDRPGRIEIRVTSPVSEAAQNWTLDAAIDRLKQLKVRTAMLADVRSEGGSGYHKLHKLLRYDLQGATDYNVDISRGPAGFCAILSLPSAPLAAVLPATGS